MIFEVEDFYVKLIEVSDLNRILEIYNSNKDFLIKHMHKEEVTYDWIFEDFKFMKEVGFYSCKIVDKIDKNIVGLIEFNGKKNIYLSLLMIHGDYKSNGIGNLIYKGFERYALSLQRNRIDIDIVDNYSDMVYDFWVNKGFVRDSDTKLNWEDKVLLASRMNKKLG